MARVQYKISLLGTMGYRLSVDERVEGRKLPRWKKTPLFLLPTDPSLALHFLMKLCTYNDGSWMLE